MRIRCGHGYGHHDGPHACDPYNHDDQCPARIGIFNPAAPIPYSGRGNQFQIDHLRTERLEHTHIFQKVNGVAGCPACESIDVWHMSDAYFSGAYQFLEAERLERELSQ